MAHTQKYDRFKAAPWFQENVKPPVLVGGGGGIGSWLTVLLTRAGFECHVFDFDNLEELNMAGQLFMHKHIGSPKVDALAAVTRELCREEIFTYNERVVEETMTNEIVFTAFDNMKARRDMFIKWKESYTGNAKAIFIDGRLTMEQLTIFSVRGNDAKAIEEYETVHLFDDSRVPEMDCTAKQTSHGAAMIAAHMVESFTNWYCGVLNADEERPVSFFWQHFMPANFTSKRNADAIELAQEAMQEDKLPEEPKKLSMEAQADLIETADALGLPMPDLPGIGGETFTLLIPENWIVPEEQTVVEIFTLQEAVEHAEMLGLTTEFNSMVDNFRRLTGTWPTQVKWRAEILTPNRMNFEEEGLQGGRPGSVRFETVEEYIPLPTGPVPPEESDEEEEEAFDDPDEEELDETPDPEETITIGGTSISIQSINANAMWETTSSNMVLGTDPYVPDEPTPDQDLTASERI